MEIHPESEWEELFRELKKHKGTALFLGATDSGKSTLVKYLAKRLTKEGITVAIVDADVGQSSLGLPGTISMKVFSDEKDIEHYTFEKMFFVGSTNPAKKTSLMVNGSGKMVDACREKSDIIFMDTTGLISGELGRALKIGKIRTIKPEHIIALQRNGELEHILRLVEHGMIHRIGVSMMAKSRERENRIKYRKKKFLDYFGEKRVSDFLIHQHDAMFLLHGKSFNLKDSDFKAGTIIGLNHHDDTIGLGVIIETTADAITFKSPLRSLRGINRVLLSEMTIPD
jgi:polynucleotide 5'-hydroxyl-kinase GRC3/NOL9